jgi:hypothetical protein
MSEREPWVPDDITEEELPYYYGTLAEGMARVEWMAREIGAHDVIARMDQLGALLRDHRETVLRDHFAAEGSEQ